MEYGVQDKFSKFSRDTPPSGPETWEAVQKLFSDTPLPVWTRGSFEEALEFDRKEIEAAAYKLHFKVYNEI
jgi:hypothetical protein